MVHSLAHQFPTENGLEMFSPLGYICNTCRIFFLTGIDFATRKIANMLKPQKVIEQDGDSFTIKTFTTFKNYTVSFKIGEEFEEVTKAMDNRKVQVETCNLQFLWTPALYNLRHIIIMMNWSLFVILLLIAY